MGGTNKHKSCSWTDKCESFEEEILFIYTFRQTLFSVSFVGLLKLVWPASSVLGWDSGFVWF